jgi:leucyl-tRNA synthetase
VQHILANEQAEGGFCWRHEDTEVERRELEQWFIRVTGYADQLLDDLQSWRGLADPGDSCGATGSAGASAPKSILRWLTPRPDKRREDSNLYDPDRHDIRSKRRDRCSRSRINRQARAGKPGECGLEEFVARAKDVSRDDRTGRAPKKSDSTLVSRDQPIRWQPSAGVDGELCAHRLWHRRNHVSSWPRLPGISSSLQKYDLPVRRVIEPIGREAPAFNGSEDDNWAVVNSGQWNSRPVLEAQRAMTEHAAGKGFGEAKVNFKIRDWGVSRQRAWGTPIPFIHCPQCGIVPVPEEQLPVVLPPDLNYNTVGSPLAEWPAFVNTTYDRAATLAGVTQTRWIRLSIHRGTTFGTAILTTTKPHLTGRSPTGFQ